MSKSEGKKMLFSNGFTILELTIIIAVIAILAAIAVPKLSGQSESAMTSQCRANRTIIERADAAYRAVHGSNSGSTIAESITNLKAQGYLTSTPSCKKAGDYSWVSSANGERRVACSEHTDAQAAVLDANASQAAALLASAYGLNSKWQNWSGTNYNAGAWNGLLELLFQEGETAKTFSGLTAPHHASNVWGYVNPFSDKEAVFNYGGKLSAIANSTDGVSGGKYGAYMPPAVLITQNSAYSPSATISATELQYVVGTLIVYRANNTSPVQMYYVNADGSKSAVSAYP